MEFHELIEAAGKVMEGAGVGVIVLGALVAAVLFAWRGVRGREIAAAYESLRETLGRAILLGLEILVAADIIRTVAVSPTFRSVGVLGILVLIRSFLSTTLTMEIEGRWPWARRQSAVGPPQVEQSGAGGARDADGHR